MVIIWWWYLYDVPHQYLGYYHPYDVYMMYICMYICISIPSSTSIYRWVDIHTGINIHTDITILNHICMYIESGWYPLSIANGWIANGEIDRNWKWLLWRSFGDLLGLLDIENRKLWFLKIYVGVFIFWIVERHDSEQWRFYHFIGQIGRYIDGTHLMTCFFLFVIFPLSG